MAVIYFRAVSIILSEPDESIRLSKQIGYRPEKNRRPSIDNIDSKKEGEKTMSNSKIVVPEAKEALEQFKMEAASEVDVPPAY